MKNLFLDKTWTTLYNYNIISYLKAIFLNCFKILHKKFTEICQFKKWRFDHFLKYKKSQWFICKSVSDELAPGVGKFLIDWPVAHCILGTKNGEKMNCASFGSRSERRKRDRRNESAEILSPSFISQGCFSTLILPYFFVFGARVFGALIWPFFFIFGTRVSALGTSLLLFCY